MNTRSYSRLISLLVVLLCCRTTVTAQNPCTMQATIVAGVECKLVDAGGLLLLPCTAPIGFEFLPVGTELTITYVPENCASFCLQGLGADIQCAQVVGGTAVGLCSGQSVQIGAPAEPNRAYRWEPAVYIDCDSCAVATVSPPGNAIYTRTETIPACLSCQPVVTYYNITVSPCSGVDEVLGRAVSLWPVPTAGRVHVTGFEFENYCVFDGRGALRMAGPGAADQTIDLALLPAGLYYLQLSSQSRQVVCKVIKGN